MDYSQQPSHRSCAPATSLRREAHSRRASDRSLSILPASSKAETQLGNVLSLRPRLELPVYLRDLVKIFPGYQAPATYLNYYTWQDPTGQWQRSRAVTLAIYMRDQQQIAKLRSVRRRETCTASNRFFRRTSSSRIPPISPCRLRRTFIYSCALWRKQSSLSSECR